jgi:hypothetical protein
MYATPEHGKILMLSKFDNSGKALNYRLFKRQLETENNLYSLDDNFLFVFYRFRNLNHKLPIESR